MSRPKQADITPLKRLDGEPVFDEPWQAQVLAMVDSLVGSGVISATLWSDTLGEALEKAEARGEADTIETYYAAVLLALEQLLDREGEVSISEITSRRDDWEQAYLHTPHGKPVHLKRD